MFPYRIKKVVKNIHINILDQRGKSYERKMSLQRLHSLCIDVRILRIESIVRYFLGIVGILEFCDFVIFPSHRNTLML